MVKLSLQCLFECLNALPNSRCITEGESILNANHIITCGAVERTTSYVKLLALCLKTSALSSNPHEIRATIYFHNKVEIKDLSCTCKAGLSMKCKHAAALLILCTRCDVEQFEEFSCTDLKCYWAFKKGAALEKYQPCPILNTYCFIKSKIIQPELPVEDNKFIVDFLCEKAKDSALAKHKIGSKVTASTSTFQIDNVCTENYLDQILLNAQKSQFLNCLVEVIPEKYCCFDFYHSISFNVDIKSIAKTTAENNVAWCKERQFRITGSRCYAIFTYSLNNWTIKSQKYFWPKKIFNRYTEHGIQHETAARNAYEKTITGTVFVPGFIICKPHPWLGFSVDGVIIENGKPVRLLEIKCPFIGLDCAAADFVKKCKYSVEDENGVQLKTKHQYYAQVQLGLAILNVTDCDFICYSTFSQSFLKINIKYDAKFTENMIQKLQYNYFNNMLHVICENK